MTMSDHEWLQVELEMTTNDHEWRRVEHELNEQEKIMNFKIKQIN